MIIGTQQTDVQYWLFARDEFDMVVTTLEMLLHGADRFAFDIETTALDERQGKIIGFGLSWKEKTACYIPLLHKETMFSPVTKYWSDAQEQRIIELMREILVAPDVIKIIQNYQFEYRWCRQHWNVEIQNKVFDTMFYAYLCDQGVSMEKLSLASLAQRVRPEIQFEKMTDVLKEHKGTTLLDHFTTKQLGDGCCTDCDVEFSLGQLNLTEIEEKLFKDFFWNRSESIIRLVTEMSSNGIRVDTQYLDSKCAEIITKEAALLNEVRVEVGIPDFNPNSHPQMQALFFKRLGAPKIDGTCLDDDVLSELGLLGFPYTKKISDYRSLKHLRATFFEGYRKKLNVVTGRLHSELQTMSTLSGRLSSRNPNLQNIQGKEAVEGDKALEAGLVKRMFIADEGYDLIGADYSQIELRLIAWRSQDPMLLKGFMEDLDLHTMTAAFLFNVDPSKVTKWMRKIAKQCNFGLCYGGSADVLVRLVGYELFEDWDGKAVIPKEEVVAKAKVYRSKYFQLYEGLPLWTKRVIKEARRLGYTQSAYGRVRYFPELESENKAVVAHAQNAAVNMDPQSTASDYVLNRFWDVHQECKRRKIGMIPLLTVHDQMVMQTPIGTAEEVCDIIRKLGVVQDEANIGVPMKIEPLVGKHLAEV